MGGNYIMRSKYPYLFAIFILFFSLTSPNISQAIEPNKVFKHQGTQNEANRFQKYLTKKWPTTGNNYEQWRTKAQNALATQDNITAINSFASALALRPNDGATWLALSQVYLATKPRNRNEKYDFPQNASSSAYKAYILLEKPEQKAEALANLAEALKRRSFWRPALNAYKASLLLKTNEEIQKAYNVLRNERGFRVLDYTVDSETETPRICIQFSENLSKARIDFTKFLNIDGKEPAGVSKNKRQLCVDGLTHGKRYIIKVREGLPSQIRDEKILKTADLSIYVRDRTPAVRFANKGYVLPKTGQNGIPLISINTDKIETKIYRVGDRALNKTILNNYIKRQFSKYDIEDLKNNLGAKIWEGHLSVKSELNKDVTTALPVTTAIKDIKPGLYVVYASPVNQKETYNTKYATQWFIISDLGLTTLKGQQGIHTFVRSLSSAEPLKNVTVRLIARNNEILGTTKTDKNGHAHFEKGLTKGEGALSPHIIIAERSEGDYAFLDVTHSAFDFTDRGVSGRANPGPLDAYIFSERGVYRTNEDVYLTALLRDQKGKAVPKIPLTLKIKRPDGVEHLRHLWPDEGNGGRSYILSIPSNAMSGTWSASLYTDPKSKSIGYTSFLVEDYSPQRMELNLVSDTKKITADDNIKIAAKGRYLYGAPASNLQLSGEILIRKNNTGLEEFKGYQFGLHDEKFLNINKKLSELPKTDTDGKAELITTLPEIPQTNKLLEAQYTVRLNEPGGKTITNQVSFPILPQKTVLGIKPLFIGNELSQRQTAEFDILAINSSAKQVELKNLNWELLKVETRYQWYANNGSWNYETIAYTKKVANGTLNTTTDKASRIKAPLDWGKYRLEITSKNPNGPNASYEFYSGWYSATNTDTPDKLELRLKQKTIQSRGYP